MKLLPFFFFVIAMTGTPGPGNLTMMAIGQTTGFRSAIPFLAGTAAGLLGLNLCVALGVGELITTSHIADTLLKIGGSLYILYLSYKILKMQFSQISTATKRFTFYEGMLVHPMSPKSWAMSVVAISQFAIPEAHFFTRILLFTGMFCVGQVFFHSLWCATGATLMHFLKRTLFRLCVSSTAVVLMICATGYALFL